MSRWHVTASVPASLSAANPASDRLFHGSGWMAALEHGLGCDSLYLQEDESGLAAGVSVFRAGPFRIGYLGFPVGGVPGSESLTRNTVGAFRTALANSGLVGLRVPASAFEDAEALDLPFEPTPETAIVDLQSWTLKDASTNRRRDVARARRSGLDRVDASNPGDGQRLYDLYSLTVERNKGALRYTADYFAELIRLSGEHPNLRVLLATLDDSIVGFNIVAKQGATGYYLHGALDWEAREHRPAALLMNEAIEWARESGCQVFNLLSSPRDQDSLVKYKEQWGAETREHRTYTLPINAAFPLFRLAERLYRIVRR